MVMNHHLLNASGVGHPALTAVVEAAAAAGAGVLAGAGAGAGGFPGFACKLTGAGGGGCAIILSPVPYTPSLPGGEQAGPVEAALGGLVDKLRYSICTPNYILLHQ